MGGRSAFRTCGPATSSRPLGGPRVLDHPASKGRGYDTKACAFVLELAFGYLGAEQACTEYLDGNHASEEVPRKLGYTGNG